MRELALPDLEIASADVSDISRPKSGSVWPALPSYDSVEGPGLPGDSEDRGFFEAVCASYFD